MEGGCRGTLDSEPSVTPDRPDTRWRSAGGRQRSGASNREDPMTTSPAPATDFGIKARALAAAAPTADLLALCLASLTTQTASELAAPALDGYAARLNGASLGRVLRPEHGTYPGPAPTDGE